MCVRARCAAVDLCILHEAIHHVQLKEEEAIERGPHEGWRAEKRSDIH